MNRVEYYAEVVLHGFFCCAGYVLFICVFFSMMGIHSGYSVGARKLEMELTDLCAHCGLSLSDVKRSTFEAAAFYEKNFDPAKQLELCKACHRWTGRLEDLPWEEVKKWKSKMDKDRPNYQLQRRQVAYRQKLQEEDDQIEKMFRDGKTKEEVLERKRIFESWHGLREQDGDMSTEEVLERRKLRAEMNTIYNRKHATIQHAWERIEEAQNRKSMVTFDESMEDPMPDLIDVERQSLANQFSKAMKADLETHVANMNMPALAHNLATCQLDDKGQVELKIGEAHYNIGMNNATVNPRCFYDTSK